MCCVTKAMPIHFINDKHYNYKETEKLQNSYYGWISCEWLQMPSGVGTHTEANFLEKVISKTRCAPTAGWHETGKITLLLWIHVLF